MRNGLGEKIQAITMSRDPGIESDLWITEH
jgi:hypothetical protein